MRIFTGIAIFLGLLLLMWVSALWLYDREKMADALAQRQALIDGGSPYHWSFDSPAELGIAHDPGQFHWSGGRLRGTLDDPYFYLNLEGRQIDARRYSVLELRLFSGAAGQLRIFHEQPHNPAIHASDFADVKPGWQIIEMNLATVAWLTPDATQPEPAYLASTWGNEAGLVSALRIDPVRAGAFEIDWVKLKPAQNETPKLSDIEVFHSLHDPLFGQMRRDDGRIWLIAQDRRVRTPESAHVTRLKIAREFPSALVFPRPPTFAELETGARRAKLAPGTLPGLVYVVALLALAGTRRAGPAWRPVLEVSGLLLAIGAAVFWAPHLPPSLTWIPGVPLLAVAWAWRPKSLWKALLGDARAWLWVAPLIFVSTLLVLAFANRVEDTSIMAMLGIYLLWALLQQFVVAVLIRDRLEPVFGALSTVLAAGAFGFLHLPNFALMGASFVLGTLLMAVYRRHRNLLAIASVHALLAVGVNLAAPHYLWLSRTIGPEFLVGL